jgi:hypothetical protein
MKVPKFKSLKEERDFWDIHDSTDYHGDFKTTKHVVFVRPKKEVISLCLEPKFIRRLRELATKSRTKIKMQLGIRFSLLTFSIFLFFFKNLKIILF